MRCVFCCVDRYGFAPKGASVLMFRSAELRHNMYSFATQWSGGIYATPTILGSRPGGVVAATWAAMMKHGEEGYIETTKQIVGATRKIGEAIEKMPGLKLMGRPEVCVVAFAGEEGSNINCYSLCDALKETGEWELATLQNPPAVHLAVTLPSSRNAAAFIADLEAALALLRSDPKKFSGGTAGLYGTASKLPEAFIEESAKVFLDMMTVCATEGKVQDYIKNGVSGHHLPNTARVVPMKTMANADAEAAYYAAHGNGNGNGKGNGKGDNNERVDGLLPMGRAIA